jgi:hypothetical protein
MVINFHVQKVVIHKHTFYKKSIPPKQTNELLSNEKYT